MIAFEIADLIGCLVGAALFALFLFLLRSDES